MPPSLLYRLFPFLNWPRVSKDALTKDLLAGLTAALLAIPQSLAYAQLAGVPAYYGLYAAIFPAVVGVLWGSSAILVTGPVAITSLLTAASVGHLAVAGSTEFIALVTLLALLSGLIQLGMGLARAGVLLNLLSHPVLLGFVNASALVIVFSQLPAVTGIAVPRTDSFMGDVGRLFARLDTAHAWSIASCVLALAMLYGFRRLAPRLPGVLITIAALTGLSYWFDFAQHGGQVVGDIPAGLPGLSVPRMDWDAIVALLPAALVIALVSFTEAMSSCKIIAVKTRTAWNDNQELVGQGLAKITAAFCNSMPVSGSFARSALNLASGARTGFSSLFAAGFILLTLLYFAPLLYYVPKPALAAIVILSVLNLVNVAGMRNAWRANRDDGVAAILTLVATLAFAPNIQNGILAGMLFSLGAFIYRRMVPNIVVMGTTSDPTAPDGAALLPVGVALLRFDAALFFANTTFFEEAVRKLERSRPGLRFIMVDAQGINMMDASAVEMLRQLSANLHDRGITLVFIGTKHRVREVAERTGLVADLGAHNFHATEAEALADLAQRLQQPATAAVGVVPPST